MPDAGNAASDPLPHLDVLSVRVSLGERDVARVLAGRDGHCAGVVAVPRVADDATANSLLAVAIGLLEVDRYFLVDLTHSPGTTAAAADASDRNGAEYSPDANHGCEELAA